MWDNFSNFLSKVFFLTKTVEQRVLVLTLVFILCLGQSTGQTQQLRQSNIENSVGLIVLNRVSGKGDFITIYNEDESPWYRFSFYYDDGQGQFPYQNSEFNPFAFHPDYFVLALKCVRKVKDRYEVIVNEESGLKKFVRADDLTLAFETWDAHVLKVFSVEFDRTRNPLLKTKQGQVRKVSLPKGTFFHPVKVEGDWLRVKWEIKGKREQFDYGWVRWRGRRTLLIELSYIC
jgi:hypothetical protein